MTHHTKKEYSLLEWDSDFFGFTVGIINKNEICSSHLETLLDTLRKQGMRLVYWTADPANDLSRDEIKRLNGLLVDQKTTFLLKSDLSDFNPGNYDAVEPYHPGISFLNLGSLAAQCGQFSRFATDPNIPRHKSIELYKLWIEKSLSGKMADAVLLIKNEADIQGLITLKNNKTTGSGEIGLLVVDEKYRNRQIGSQLVRAGLKWFGKSNAKFVRVVTQGANTTACRFYEKCGFLREKSVNFYHFWL